MTIEEMFDGAIVSKMNSRGEISGIKYKSHEFFDGWEVGDKGRRYIQLNFSVPHCGIRAVCERCPTDQEIPATIDKIADLARNWNHGVN